MPVCGTAQTMLGLRGLMAALALPKRGFHPGGMIMDFYETAGLGRSPRLVTALQIVLCVIAAIWLTAVADVVTLRVIDWIGIH